MAQQKEDLHRDRHRFIESEERQARKAVGLWVADYRPRVPLWTRRANIEHTSELRAEYKLKFLG